MCIRDRFYRTAYNPTAIEEEDIDEYVRCYAAPGGMRAGFEYYRALWTDVEHNTENAKTKLTMPVLALGGKYSFGKRTLTTMQTLAENVRGGEIDKCGHWISEEQPEYLVEQLLTFFSEKEVTT